MVYDWSGDKEGICFRLYITEGKSLEEVMERLKEEQGFAPRYVERHLLPCAVYTLVDEKVNNGNLPVYLERKSFDDFELER